MSASFTGLDFLINGLKDQILGRQPTRRTDNPCFIVCFDTRTSDHGYDPNDGNKQLYDEISDARSFYFVFCNNTTVWSLVRKDEIFPDPKDLEYIRDNATMNVLLPAFKHESDHDSCWRSITSDVLFKHHCEIYEKLSVHRLAAGEKIVPNDYTPFITNFKIATGTLDYEYHGYDKPVNGNTSTLLKVTVDDVITNRKIER
ncbi:hypothetical protein EVB32_072 [Rhizobium phage RHph_TM39]|uniref:Uncharacterized protein n=1 Tax=Rhizobium phage RHph_TM30 TaxID=2509764 RepID=A0A7S5REL4_9CAUD|nr:hypothetical protein PQC16_gp072 [Rhizobium phage RHph_TM30]QIG71179.1 hypothetical protein EVB93_072 [Rhizobium phage RHph_TM30]QIG77060.1 hypothetical protein EVB32_072 [Rhizobium phage RHph_TM39]QIG77400.1 hypothetical protein EVB61_072 [Rhizobium phage RHph_TM21B]QIG77659.1 hypothetical protein EVB64_072 [Rhizobium phage RHph_TM61]